jgi:excinuclease UvrABC nuclease subunit
VIESLPTVGYQTRKKLLKVFPTIKELANATVEELMQIDGIGKKTAQKIHATLN